MKRRGRSVSFLTVLVTTSLAIAAVACSVNLYKPLAKNDSVLVQKEQALMALDKKDYSKAESIFASLWENSKDNETAQYYAVSILGTIGLDIFSVLTKAMTSCQDSGDKSCSGNDLMSRLNSALPDGFDSVVGIVRLKEAVDILNLAPTKAAVAPLTCFAGGIYMNLLVTSLKTQITTIQTNLKSDLAAVGTSCAGGSKSQADVGASITASLTALETISTNIKTATTAVGDCISAVSGGTSTANDIQKTLTDFYSAADLGCTLPATGVVGGLTFPTCMNSFVTDPLAAAGDGKIAGCEVFINCLSGSCIK